MGGVVEFLVMAGKGWMERRLTGGLVGVWAVLAAGLVGCGEEASPSGPAVYLSAIPVDQSRGDTLWHYLAPRLRGGVTSEGATVSSSLPN